MPRAIPVHDARTQVGETISFFLSRLVVGEERGLRQQVGVTIWGRVDDEVDCEVSSKRRAIARTFHRRLVLPTPGDSCSRSLWHSQELQKPSPRGSHCFSCLSRHRSSPMGWKSMLLGNRDTHPGDPLSGYGCPIRMS